MDMKGEEVVSVRKSCYTERKGICILVVNDDVTCSNVVTEMLQYCSHEVLHIGGFLDAFNAMWEIKGGIDHVITNVHNLESNGALIGQHIEEKLNVPVLLMGHHGEKMKSKGKPFSFTAYILNGLSINDVDRLWQYALATSAYQHFNPEGASVPNTGFVRKNASSVGEPECLNQTSKRPREEYGKNKEDKESSGLFSVAKKPRVVWTVEMHQKFLEAIEIIGYEKAVPKKIVELMGIPGLTRENVASHLQKFRGSLKRTQEASLSLFSGRSTAMEYKGLLGLSSASFSRLSSLPRNAASLLSSAEGLQFLYPDSVDRLQQRHIAGLQMGPNFQRYCDKTRDMLLSFSADCSQPSGSIFVGYTLTSDGNSIVFGDLEASGNGKSTNETQVSSTPWNSGSQHNLIWDVPIANIPQQLSLLGTTPGGMSFQCQPLPGINLSENPAQSIPMAASNSSTLFPPDEEFLMPALETPTHGNELAEQKSHTFLQGISQAHQPYYNPSSCPQIIPQEDAFFEQGGIDDNLARETGSTSAQFDLQVFDDVSLYATGLDCSSIV